MLWRCPTTSSIALAQYFLRVACLPCTCLPCKVPFSFSTANFLYIVRYTYMYTLKNKSKQLISISICKCCDASHVTCHIQHHHQQQQQLLPHLPLVNRGLGLEAPRGQTIKFWSWSWRKSCWHHIRAYLQFIGRADDVRIVVADAAQCERVEVWLRTEEAGRQAGQQRWRDCGDEGPRTDDEVLSGVVEGATVHVRVVDVQFQSVLTCTRRTAPSRHTHRAVQIEDSNHCSWLWLFLHLSALYRIIPQDQTSACIAVVVFSLRLWQIAAI